MRITTVEQVDAVLEEAAVVATDRLRTSGPELLKYEDPTKNEKALFEIIREICERDFTADSVVHIGGHKFPDIVFPHANSGVEVKGHKRDGDALRGNSIMGSTFSLVEPKAVRLLVWADSSKTVSAHDYFDSVVGAEVTHSPRFRLQPGAAPEDRLFGTGTGQVGAVGDVCLGPNGIDSELILARMRAKALAEGNFPWWIGDDKPMAVSGSFSISRFSNLKPSERILLESVSTFIFPAVMGQRSATKYHDVIAWAIATRGVLLSRDNFSANGRADLSISSMCEKHVFRVPRSFAQGVARLSKEFEVSLEELRVYWNVPGLKASDVISHFKTLIDGISFKEVAKSVSMEMCDSCWCKESEVESTLKALVLERLNVRFVD